jgi:hypothetical protein
MNFTQFILGACSSLVASFVFLFAILVFLRPSIKIGKTIVMEKDNEGKDCYRIKFYNTSIFSAYDAIINLVALDEQPAEPKGKHIYFNDIPLTKYEFNVIFRWLPMILTKNYAHNCTQIKTFENLEDILKHPNKSLQLKITLRHGLTGLSKTFVKNYHTKAILEKGSFAFGNSFEVIKTKI